MGNRNKFRTALLEGSTSLELARATGQAYSRTSTSPAQFRRNSDLRPPSINENERSVESVIATETPTNVYDSRRHEVILEVLLADGAEFESDTPLIRDHNRWTTDELMGSCVNTRAESTQLVSRLRFLGDDAGDNVRTTWAKVKGGALRRVSAGYSYAEGDFVTLDPGETRTVKGRSFTAPADRALRVVFRWILQEVSLVVVPADPYAQMRSSGTHGNQSAQSTPDAPNQTSAPHTNSTTDGSMKKFLRYLHSCGLASSVTDQTEALRWAGDGNLTDAQLEFFRSVCEEESITFDRAAAQSISQRQASPPAANPTAPTTQAGGQSGQGGQGTQGGQRQVPANDPGTGITLPGQPVAGEQTSNQQRSTDDAAQQAVVAERQRAAAIREMGRRNHLVTNELVETLIDGGYTIDQSRQAVLAHVEANLAGQGGGVATAQQNGQRTGAGMNGFGGGNGFTGVPETAPAGHVRGSGDVNLHVLQAAVMSRHGFSPDSEILNDNLARGFSRRSEFDAAWMVGQRAGTQGRDNLERNFDIAHQHGLDNCHLRQMAAIAVELETGQRLYSDDDIMERAFSSGLYTTVYGATVHMQLLQSYARAATDYSRFCSVMDVPDLRENKTADMGQVSRLKKQGKDGVEGAPLLNVGEEKVFSVTAERYAGQIKITDTMIINDTLGVTNFIPAETGEACRQMIEDLVLAQMLRSDNLADGRARYNTTDGNLITAASVNDTMFENLGVALKAKKVGDRRIAIGEGVIVAGLKHIHKVRKFMTSETIDHANNTHRGTYQAIETSAIDIGVSDPADDETEIASTPNSLYAFAGSELKRSIAVAFRAGTNRGPVTRSFTLDKGSWGVGWDVLMDVGAAFQRRIGTVKVNGLS